MEKNDVVWCGVVWCVRRVGGLNVYVERHEEQRIDNERFVNVYWVGVSKFRN